MIWTQKPPYGTPIDPFGPFASGLYGVYAINECAGQALYNLAPSPSVNDGAFQSGTAAPTWTRGLRGPGITCVSASSQYVSCGNFPALNSATRMSMFVLGGATTGTHVTAARASLSSGGGSIVIGLESTHSGFWEVELVDLDTRIRDRLDRHGDRGKFLRRPDLRRKPGGICTDRRVLEWLGGGLRVDNRLGALESSRGLGCPGDRL